MVNGIWVQAKCPLAPYKHKSGKDTNPSFGISLETGMFNCFACESGSLESLVQALELYASQTPHMEAKYNFPAAREALAGIESDLFPLPEYTEFPDKKYVFEEWPEYFIEQFPLWTSSSLAVQYLANRDQPVDPVVACKMDLRYDAQWQRIVCPYRTVNGKLAGARGRAIYSTSPMKHHEYLWNKVSNANIVLYNEPALEWAAETGKPIVVVEGQFDCMSVLRVYPGVVAGLTAKMSLPKMAKLQNVPGVVVLMDRDAAGEAAWPRYRKYLEGKVQLGRVEVPAPYKDPGEMPVEVLQDVLGDLL
jgi:DNA primase